MKKAFIIQTLICLGITGIFLILTIFGINFFTGTKFNILVSFATLTGGGYFCLLSCDTHKANKILGIVSFVLVGLSVLLVILSFWLMSGNVGDETFFDITSTIALLTCVFVLVASTYLKLGKKYLVVQIVLYCIVSVFVLICILLVFEVFAFKNIATFFWLILVLTIISLIVLKVMTYKTPERVETNYVKITKEEYDILLDKAKKWDDYTNKNN